MQIAVQRVAADADDLDRACRQDVAIAGVHADRDSLADRILIRKSCRGETLVDDGDFRRRRGVVDAECSSGHDRDAERLEEVNADGIVGLGLIRACVNRFALRQERSSASCSPDRYGASAPDTEATPGMVAIACSMR